MTIRIVIGGPPGSGKSSFVASLRRALLDIGVQVDYVELDPYSSTLALIEGLMTPEERIKSKRKDIPDEEIQKIAERLADLDRKLDVVLGDLPGMVTPQTSILCKHATHAIIVCKDQRLEEMYVWQEFFSNLGIPVISKIVSKLKGAEETKITDANVIEAIMTGLDREVKVSDTLARMALQLKAILNL